MNGRRSGARDQRLIVFEIDETNVGSDGAVSARTTAVLDPNDCLQPCRRSESVSGTPLYILLTIGNRVQSIGILVLPSQARSQKCADSRLPASRNPHDHPYRRTGRFFVGRVWVTSYRSFCRRGAICKRCPGEHGAMRSVCSSRHCNISNSKRVDHFWSGRRT
jgi:hypothetical protein